MYEILIIVFLIIAIAIVGLVLIQKGKGADMGASFGAGASATLFGSAGTGNFLTRTTTILGILFFIVSLALANISSKKDSATTSPFSNIGNGTPSTTAVQLPATGTIPTDNGSTGSQPLTIKPEQTSPTSDIPE